MDREVLEARCDELDKSVGRIDGYLSLDCSPDLEGSGVVNEVTRVEIEFNDVLERIREDRELGMRRCSTLFVWDKVLSLFDRLHDGNFTRWDASGSDVNLMKVRLGRIRDTACEEGAEQLFGIRYVG
jgi:hypothetical protein